MDNLPLSIKIVPSQHAGQCVLALSGPLTLTNLFNFQEAVCAESAPVMIIDMGAVPFIDSAGLGSIINAHINCSKTGRRLALAAVPERVRSLLKMTGVEQIFAIFPSAQEAQENLAR